jgi:hypothetical protein
VPWFANVLAPYAAWWQVKQSVAVPLYFGGLPV